MLYILVAYKSDSEDYLMGCVRGTYFSDFVKLRTDKREEVVNALSEILLNNMEKGHGEEEYDTTLFINGNEYLYDGNRFSPVLPVMGLEYEESNFIAAEAFKIAEGKYKNHKEIERKKYEEKENKEKNRRKELYNDLKKEFGD
jgi:hypothetical protein